MQVGVRAIAASRLLWGKLDPADLPGTRDEWLSLQVRLLRTFDEQSARLAAAYVAQYRTTEGHPGGPVVGADEFDAPRVASSLGYLGPGKIAILLDAATDDSDPDADAPDPGAAKDRVRSGVAGAVMRHALQGGRRVVDLSTLANPRSVGWRRVSDGDPCGFCLMLVSRGPAYRSESSAGEGRDWHDRCGCSAEEVFGTWRPNERESTYIDAYDTAAEKVDGPRTQESVLPQLRALGYR